MRYISTIFIGMIYCSDPIFVSTKRIKKNYLEKITKMIFGFSRNTNDEKESKISNTTNDTKKIKPPKTFGGSFVFNY